MNGTNLKEIAHQIQLGTTGQIVMFDTTKQYGFTYLTLSSAIQNWPAAVSATEVGYLDGVTSAIQTQLDTLTAAIAALGTPYHAHVTGLGGTGNAITGTIAPARTLAVGDRVTFKAGANNSGATTITLTGATPATAIAIQKKGVACSGGEIDNGGMYTLVYASASVFELVCGD